MTSFLLKLGSEVLIPKARRWGEVISEAKRWREHDVIEAMRWRENDIIGARRQEEDDTSPSWEVGRT